MSNLPNGPFRIVWAMMGTACLFFALSTSKPPASPWGLALAALQVQLAFWSPSCWQQCRWGRWAVYGAGIVLAAWWIYSEGARTVAYPEALFLAPMVAVLGDQRREGLFLIGAALITGIFLGPAAEPHDIHRFWPELAGWTILSLAWWFIVGHLWERHRLAVRQEELLRRLRQEYDETRARLAEAEYLAVTDHLTRLFNQRYFDHMLEKLTQEPHKLSSLSVLMVDLDHFKEVNDKYGHMVGNQVLREVSELLKHQVRAKDVVARYGGEEFALILPGADCGHAQQVAERIRKAIEEHVFARDKGVEVRLTVSIGIASWPHDARDKTELLSRADAALYMAKRAGRNSICAYTLAQGLSFNGSL
ncbi:GGDEF domain-containing protein [Thermanaeromonas sp. C210]|uniref:GGDEF domain-containing protein n=1 Tax=Thermanaeromonas sp. C210 TaxID=2731925 RepID=UPI00155C71D7|nr:sensor domain-containing diguanylate cyclase [Thermanaeromonas sp. C210]GFN22757.1 GGDEF domain-containing protein [Thermanaeromonas sp. C210]